MTKHLSSKQTGFTLVEVIVALVILSVLSLLTMQAVRSAISTKQALSADIERESQLADTLRIIRTDIGSAFHYRDIFVTMMNDVNGASTPAPGANGQQAPPPTQGVAGSGATPSPTPIPTTGFAGEKDSLYFTTTSNVRVMRDSPESSQAKVGYFLKSCTPDTLDSKAPKVSTRCLVRTISTALDDDVTKNLGPETILVANVEDFKLRYLGPGHDDFVDTWKTGPNGDASSKDSFPYAVEVTLTLFDRSNAKEKPVTGTVLAAIRFPNNPPQQDPLTGQTNGNGTNGTSGSNGSSTNRTSNTSGQPQR